MRDAWYSPKTILRLFWEILWLWYVSRSVGVIIFATQFLLSLNKLLKAWWWICRAGHLCRTTVLTLYHYQKRTAASWDFVFRLFFSYDLRFRCSENLVSSHLPTCARQVVFLSLKESFEHKQEVVKTTVRQVWEKKDLGRVCVCVCVCAIVMILGPRHNGRDVLTQVHIIDPTLSSDQRC